MQINNTVTQRHPPFSVSLYFLSILNCEYFEPLSTLLEGSYKHRRPRVLVRLILILIRLGGVNSQVLEFLFQYQGVRIFGLVSTEMFYLITVPERGEKSRAATE